MMRLLLVSVALIASLVVFAACGDDGEEEILPAITPPATEPATEGVPPLVQGEVTVTDSGLQIIEIEAGSGDEAVAGQTVSIHYTGYLADGTKFDSSLDRGQPLTFVLGAGQMIPGFDEGVAGMKVGDKRRLILPPDLAYGPQGRPPLIPPNAELTFDVELMEIAQP